MYWFKQLSFKFKILFTVLFACVICGSVALAVAIHYNNKEFHNGLIEKARTIHGRLDAAAKYVATQGGLKPMIERYTQKYKDPSELTPEDKKIILQQVPIYASMAIGSDEAAKEHYEFRVFSNEARNEKNKATSAELEIFKRFESDSTLKEIVTDTDTHVTVYRPVFISEKHGCLTCHGEPSTSPWGNGTDILGYKLEGWKDGKLHGVFAISSEIKTVLKAEADAGKIPSTRYLIIFIALGALLALFTATLITRGPIGTLNRIAEQLNDTGNQVAIASNQIATSADTLSQSTTEQAASLEQTAASLEQITSMIAKASENAKTTATSSTESHHSAVNGQNTVTEMSRSMKEISQSNDEIQTQVTSSNQQMIEIVKLIQGIGEKTRVINDIVFQTKLLSFNASVEAARAGEHGKGFAVVAEEVGNLAQMSGNAAKEISTLLEDSIAKVEAIVEETKSKVEGLILEGKQKVSSGVQTAETCADMLNAIVDSVSKVSGLAQEISNATKEQSQGVTEINKAMGQLDAVTQQNAKTSEESARAAERLSKQARTLKSVVDDLTQTLSGGTRKIAVNIESESHSGPKNILSLVKKENANPIRDKPVPQKAVGDDTVPSRDHDGFKDV